MIGLTDLKVATIGLTAIAITAMATGHDGVTVQAVISGILIIAGYSIGKGSRP